MDSKEKCCCFTGHRYISAEHKPRIEKTLHILIQNLARKGVTSFIAGGALGFDTLAAQTVLDEKMSNSDLKLILALPCKNQFKNWHKADIDTFLQISSAADDIIYVSDEYYEGCMLKRNRFMVDMSSHCIFYMRALRGGTAYTVKYAVQNDLELHNIMTESPL